MAFRPPEPSFVASPPPGAALKQELQRAFTLSDALAARIAAHCALWNERPADFIADVIVLALDAHDLEAGTS